jgi:hypothetical protein
MGLIRIRKKEFNQTFLGLLLTSFYSYLPHISFLFIFIQNYKKLRINKILLHYSLILIFFLSLSFLFTFNFVILRFLGLIVLSLFLYSILQIFFTKYEKIFFNLPDKLFYIHAIVTALTFFSPKLNAILSGVEGTTGRISGLVGFDYMAFFFGIYLISDYLCSNRKVSISFILKLLLSTLFVILSGRFGIIIIIFILLYIYFDSISIKKTFLFLLIILFALLLLREQVQFIYQSMGGFWSYLLDNSNTDLKEFSDQNSNDEGFYSASPITWLNMFLRPFLNIINFILPSSESITVDPGPSYMVLNLGLILTVIIYHYFSLFFKINKTVIWPFLIIYLLTDIKYHGILVPSCMFWLFLNLNRIKKYENYK